MFVTKKHISRRAVLQGMGVTVALPLLEAMVPARTAWAKTVTGKRRLVCIEMVHGAAGSTDYGRAEHLWSPAGVGRAFDLAPTSMSPLEPFRDYLTIISDTDVRNAEAFDPSEIGADHVRSCAVTFTQARLKHTRGADVEAGTSLDQVYAKRFGQDTPIPSLQLCIDGAGAGCSSFGYSCVYQDTISWASPTEPLPMVRDPRVVFDQLFGAGATPAERAQRRVEDRSILDAITAAVARLTRELGGADRLRLTKYLDDIREIERRIQQVEAYNRSGELRELPEAPIGVPDSFSEHVKLMFDLQALAFASDLTRVTSFKLARDASARAYPESGVKTGFHPCSHHDHKEDRIAEFAKVNRYHVSQLPYFLEKLKSTPDGDSNLLENSVVVYASPMADSQVHSHRRCPLFLVGHGGGQLKGNLHLQAPDGTPMANAFLSVLHTLGADQVERFGDSTGALDLTTVPDTTAAAKG
jgi:hypothetical protein